MRFSFSLLIFAVVAAALPAPAPQDIGIAIDAFLAMPGHAQSQATAQTFTYLSKSTAARATSTVLPVSTVYKHNIAKRTACAPQPAGIKSFPYSPDTPPAFASNSAFASRASSVAVPSGYSKTFTNLDSSINAYSYLGYTNLQEYDACACAAKCNAINGCMSFNIYFERDPSLNPGSGCPNPASVTTIKCEFWGGPASASNANNYGQIREQFTVAIAGSNAYTNNSLIVPETYIPANYLGNVAINSPYDAQGYNTFMASTVFRPGPFNASLCAEYCDTQTKYNLEHPASDGSPPKVCRFFNTYLLYVNSTAHMQGQYCSLYTEAWSSAYATNNGQWRGNDHYMIEYSYSYTNSFGAGYAPQVGDKNGAIHQAAVDINYATLQPFCSSFLGYTIPVTTVSTTVTSIPLATVTFTTTALASATTKPTNIIKRAISTPDVLTKYPATVISSACSMQVTNPTSTSTTTSTITVTGSTSYAEVMVTSTIHLLGLLLVTQLLQS